MFSKSPKTFVTDITMFEKRSYFDPTLVILFKQLRLSLPHSRIFPRLALSSLVGVPHEQVSSKQALLAQYVLDFVIFNRQWEALCAIVIEREHPAFDLSKLKSHLTQAKINNLHWHEHALPTQLQLTEALSPFAQTETIIAQAATASTDPNAHLRLQGRDHPHAISLDVLRHITPLHQLRDHYPHIWKRIFILLAQPQELAAYLTSLHPKTDSPNSLAKAALAEVFAIEAENAKHLRYLTSMAAWDNTVVILNNQ